MGNSECPSNEEIKKKFKEEINELKELIIEYIDKSYKQKKNLSNDNLITYLQNWKNEIKQKINSLFQKKNEEIEQILSSNKTSFKTKKIIKKNEKENEEINAIPEKMVCEKLDFITSKDIQIKNLEITREFESYYSRYIDDKEKIENETIAPFLKNIANIARMSFNESNKFLKILYEEYEKTIKVDDLIIYSNEQFKKEFSSWVKKNDYSIEKKIIDYLNMNKLPKIQEKNNYNLKLFKDLFTLYFQSELSFPPIEIDFKEEENYNYNKMYDILRNKGKEIKVNFVFFPSLSSNGNYLENGKQWVFTYINDAKKKTFFFEKLDITQLINEINRFQLPKLTDKIKLDIKVKKYLVPKPNFNIADDINMGYIFQLKNKKTGIIENSKKKGKILIDDNTEFVQCDLIIMGEKILSIKDLN